MPINAGDSGSKVQSLGGEDPLEKEMATHSSILAWVIPWTEEPGGLQSMGSQESDATYRLNHHHTFTPTPASLGTVAAVPPYSQRRARD